MDLLLCRGVVRDYSLGSRRRTRATSAHLAREGGSSRSSWRDRRPRACPRASGGRTRGIEWRAARQTRPYKYEISGGLLGCYRPIALRFSYHFTYLSRTFVTCHDSSNEARRRFTQSPYQPSANGTNSLVNPSKGTKFAHAGEFLFFSSALSKWLSTARMFVPRRVSGAALVRSNTILTLSSKLKRQARSASPRIVHVLFRWRTTTFD